MSSFDLIVIGSGPAGQKAALQGAKAGKKVAIVENAPAVGGACLHYGTLPSKSFRESVYRYSLSSRGILGQEYETKGRRKTELPEMKRLIQRRDRVVSGESQIVFDQLKRNGITILSGHARFVGPHELELTSRKGKKRIQGEFIFIAVGSGPKAPPSIPVDGKRIHDSNTILTLKQTPKTAVVLGGGVIGTEYASIFSMAGTRVYLVDKRDQILSSVDREVVAHLLERFVAQGVETILNAQAEQVAPRKNDVQIKLSNGRKIKADIVLVALGRQGNTEDLGLSAAGITADERGLIQVDRNYRTSAPHIYAVGDVIGAPALASTSMEQGRIACCHAFQLRDWGPYEMGEYFPYGIYTIPEISMVGKTEEECKAEKIDFVVGRARYRELARGQIVGDRWGLLKMLVDRKTLKLHGVHIIGDNAAELLHIGQAVMTFGGDVNYFIRSVFNYPTLAEAYKTAAFHAFNLVKGTTKTR